jgi:transcriptional regulator with GAF, ATPase, and Fis domain
VPGAATRHTGKFEQAHRGTLFLDEIGDMPPAMQAKLLRVLEEGQVERVGGDRPVAVDVRVVVATHRDLDELVKKGLFRQDLYHRVYVYPLALPGGAVAAGESAGATYAGMLAQRTDAFERDTILAELKRQNQRMTLTARALGLERSHLYKKCQQLGIDLRALRRGE